MILKKTICQSCEEANRQSEEMKKDNQASVYKVSETKPQSNKKFLNKDNNASHKKPVYRKPPDIVKMLNSVERNML